MKEQSLKDKAIKTVSVVMCTYNGEKFIREQLDSIVHQTYPIQELIVQDDCSSDATVSIIEEYAGCYPYIQVYQNERNLGFNRNFREAMLKATGEFIAISDQDDVWMLDKIEKQVEAIGDKDLCFSSYYRGKKYPEESKIVSPSYNIERLMFSNCIPGHTMLIKRSFLQYDNIWKEHTYYDWWFLINASFHDGIAKIDIPLNWHRTHDDSAITIIHKKYGREGHFPPYYPYIYGYSSFKKLKTKQAWNVFYTFIKDNTSSRDLSYKISELMLSDKFFSVIKLCCICMKRRKDIYPNKNICGMKGYIRGFFYPFINAYNNTSFEL